MKKYIVSIGQLSVIILLLTISCTNLSEKQTQNYSGSLVFDTNHLVITANYDMVKGQLLYMPVYSSVPYQEEGRVYSLSAFLSIHNTDFNYPILINKVLYFNTKGELVRNYLKEPVSLSPLQTKDFLVPESDTAGFGANFVVEWISDSLVSAPLIETVMIGITNGQGISFLSRGKVLGIRK